MQTLNERIYSLLLASGLNGTEVDFKHFVNKKSEVKEDTNFISYYYTVGIPEIHFINKYDRWDTYSVNSKISKFNKLAIQRIKFAKVVMKPVDNTGYRNTDTLLKIVSEKSNYFRDATKQ